MALELADAGNAMQSCRGLESTQAYRWTSLKRARRGESSGHCDHLQGYALR